MRRSSYKTGLCLLAAVGLLAIGLVSAGCDDDDHEESEKQDTIDIGVALGHVSILQLKTTIDSIHADIRSTYQSVEPILKNSCFDCHSDKTDYPWYHSLPVFEGMIDSDIKEAREHLDMTDGFPFEGLADQLTKLREISEEIKEGDMPPICYRFMNWGKSIEGTRQDSLFVWVDESIEKLETVYQSLGIPIVNPDDDNDDNGNEHEGDDHD